MASYPVFPQSSVSSREERSTGRQLDRSSNGVPKIRVMYTTQKKTFTVYHFFLNLTQKLALEQFLSDNALLAFTFVWDGDGISYTCVLGDVATKYDRSQSGPASAGNWDVTVELLEA